jgi:hypothetical protein
MSVTPRVPTAATSAALTVTVADVVLLGYEMECDTPLTITVVAVEMPEPFTVREKAGEPATTVAGLIEVSVGSGLTTGRAKVFEMLGLRTVKDKDPAYPKYCALRVKLTDCAEMKVVGCGLLFK